MQIGHFVYFPPFRLDLLDAYLWQEKERIVFISKDFAILAYLRGASATAKRQERTKLGYRRFRHGTYQQGFKEWPGTLQSSAVPRRCGLFGGPLAVPVQAKFTEPQ